MKRIASLLLAVVLLFGVFPITTKAASGPMITSQPKSVTVPEGNKVTLKVKATGDDLSYRWYYKSPGAASYKKSSITKATYSATMKESWDGRKLYCKITDGDGNTVKSKTVTLTLAKKAEITSQPKSTTVLEGDKVTLKVKATGDGLTYVRMWTIIARAVDITNKVMRFYL